MFGLVYSPWERVTTRHHGYQVSLFLLTGTVLSFLCCPQQCCFLDNFQPHVHADSLHVLLKVILTLMFFMYSLNIVIIIQIVIMAVLRLWILSRFLLIL